MIYGEKYQHTLRNRISNETIKTVSTYKYTVWSDPNGNRWHTNDNGDGLWRNEEQILGTCQFSTSGCETEKAAKAKIQKYYKENY